MRTKLVCLVALVLATPAAGQTWLPAFGLEGGFARFKPAGTHANDYVDFVGLPGSSFVLGSDPFGTLFAVIPVAGRFAVEPSLSFSEATISPFTVSNLRVGARLDAAFGPHVYGAIGGVINYFSLAGGGSSGNVGPPGLSAALGFRTALTGRLEGRVEAQFTAERGSKTSTLDIVPTDWYSVLVGVSSSFRARQPLDTPDDELWSPAIGIQGGYYSDHFVGAGTLTGVALPGLGTSTGLTVSVGDLFPQTPSLMAVIPEGRRWAIEPGFGLGRVQVTGPAPFTLTSVTVAARVDYAVTRGWYAAAGPVTNSYKASRRQWATQSGLSLAWGYRFNIAGDVGGRAEASYTMFAHNHILGVPPANVLGLDFGVMMGL